MGDKVCRNCWSWYPATHLVCPKCRIRLTAAEANPPQAIEAVPSAPSLEPVAAASGPTVPMPAEPAPTGSGLLSSLSSKLTAGAGAVLLVALFVLLLGARYFSPVSATDGSFSVKAPSGWTATSDVKFSSGEKPLLALVGPIQDGLQAHFLVAPYPGGYIPMSEIEAAWPRLVETQGAGQNGAPGPLSKTTVDGAPAITSDSSIAKARIEFVVVDHAGKTYLVWFTGAASAFADLRSSGFDRIIASWHWN